MKCLSQNLKLDGFVMLFLMAFSQQMASQSLLENEVTVDGVVYQILSKTDAHLIGLSDNFVGTKVVMADYVQSVWDITPRGASSMIKDTVMVPVTQIGSEFSQNGEGITSLTLSKTFEGTTNDYYFLSTKECRTLPYYTLPKSLSEILVSEENAYFSSNNGLLCDVTGDTLLRVPYSYIENEKLIIPKGIHCIPFERDVDIYPKNITLNDTVSFFYLQSKTGSTVSLKNNYPPALGGSFYNSILKVPAGSASRYYNYFNNDSKPLAVIEEGEAVQQFHENGFNATSIYDTDGDGEMELIGLVGSSGNIYSLPYPYRNSFVSVKNGECVYRDSINDEYRHNGNYSGIINSFEIAQIPNDNRLVYDLNYDGSSGDKYVLRQTGNNQCSAIINAPMSLFVDVDNDGLKDIISKYDSSDGLNIYMQQSDGSFVKTDQFLTEKAEEIKASGNGSIVSFLQGFLRNSMFVDDAPSPFEHITKAVDFNNDGILDFVDDVAGGIMYSYDDGKYLTNKAKEIVCPVDIDNDGVLDYVVFDGEILYLMDNVNSASSEKKELFKNKKIDKVFFKDFDHDGDIDILAFINNGVYGNYTSYFVFLRNNGDGTFRKKESSMADTQYTLVDCRDYDADGKYELLIKDTSTGQNWNPKNDGILIKVENDFTISTISETFGIPQSSSYTYGKNLMLGDFDNDGFTEFYSNGGDVYGVLKSQTTQNTAPKKMAKPTALLDTETNRLKIIWAKGEDKETSACDLTYALRIGTAPGLDDVLRPASLPDGTRRTIREGEMGTALFTLFNAASLKPGKYYIAVQAIDAGGLGGQFSDELEYDHRFIAPKFYVSAYQLSTADTLEVYVKNTISGANYEWTTNEGEFTEKKDDGAKIVFHQAGDHQINLVVHYNGNDYKSGEQTICVEAAKSKGSSKLENWPFDFNQDGFVDGFSGSQFSSNSYGQIDAFKNHGDGTYSKILLSTFADLNGYINFVTDFNHDGYPDFVIRNCTKGNVFLNYGEQDYDFDYQTKDIKYPTYSTKGIDMNNDGWPDYIDYGLCYSQKNLKDYTSTSFEELIGASGRYLSEFAIYPQLVDVDRDGFLDIVWAPRNETDKETIVLCRYKDKTAACSYSEPKVLFKLPYELRQYNMQVDNPDPETYKYVYAGNTYHGNILADFNNDGYLDLALAVENVLNKTRNNGDDEIEEKFTFYIFKGKPEGESSEVALKIDNVYSLNAEWGGHAYDINNDGYVDIPYFEMNASRKWNGWNDAYAGDICTLFMKPDFGYEIANYESSEVSELVPLNLKGDYLLVDDDLRLCQQMHTNIPNQSPKAPDQVTGKQTKDGMLITWSDAVDKETPAMQMRYNVSVKRKGKKGEGAFIISPMNGLMDEAAIVPGYDYKKSTQMLIPASVLTAGETYEIQVQAIDLWGAHSPMTKTVELTMDGNGYIDMTDRIATNKETTLKYVGTQATSYSLQPGEGGQIVKDNGKGEFVVSWSTEGLKEIVMTVGNTQVKSTITVQKPYDMTFEVPSLVLAGTPIAIKAPADMIALARNVGWRCDKNNVDVKYTSRDEYAYITFPKTGTYILEAYCTDSIRGKSCQQQITVTDEMPAATIQRVDTYGNNYFVAWDETALPAYINKVVVLREGNSLNQFVVMDTVSVSQGYYIDATSNALVVSNRYRIMLLATNGQASEMSDIHKPLHVMLGYSPLGGYNLMWNSYEGLTVDNYQIWRGTNPDNMEFYAQVAGSQQNYTDLSPAEGNNYYSIVFNPQTTHRSARRASPVNDESIVRSNWVSSDGGTAIVLAQSIEITTGTVTSLTKETPTVNLYCNILPAYSTIGKVSWGIVEGAEFATIDSEGRLTAKEGVGTVVVRATTIDGSNLKTEISIPCNVPGKLLGDVNGDGVVDVSDAVATIDVILQNLSGLLVLSNYDVNADSDVDVMDVTKIVGIILANNSSNAPRRAAMNRLALEDVQITLEGDGFLVDVERPEQYTAFQFDVEVPEGLSVTDVMLGDGMTKHNLHFAKKGLNTYTVVGLSLANELLPSTAKGLIDIRLSGTQGGDVIVKNIMFVNPKGEKTYFNNKSVLVGTTGIYGVSTRQIPHSIYDLSGRKLDVDRSQLERGIYIINGKKVIIK